SQVLSVGRESHLGNALLVPRERLNTIAAGHIPDADGPVAAAGGQPLAVGGEGQRGDLPLMSFKGALDAAARGNACEVPLGTAGGEVDEVDWFSAIVPAKTTHGEQSAIGRESGGVELAFLSRPDGRPQHAYGLAGIHVPETYRFIIGNRDHLLAVGREQCLPDVAGVSAGVERKERLVAHRFGGCRGWEGEAQTQQSEGAHEANSGNHGG